MQILRVEKGLPEKAGDVEIEYSELVKAPVIRDGKITIPLRLGVEIFSLLGGMQIMVRNKRENVNSEGRYYFGGTDNSPEKTPFLTEIVEGAFKEFEEQGEDAFYEHLVPDEIKFFSNHPGNQFQKQLFEKEELQKHPNIIRRQGDIFAVPIPYDEQDLEILIDLFRLDKSDVVNIVVGGNTAFKKETRLFSTRHIFKYDNLCISNGRFAIGEGGIIASDHNPLILEGGLHLIMRAKGLVDQD